METSEDEEQKKKEAALKKDKKQLTEAQLSQEISISLSESDTMTHMYIPGIIVGGETEEFAITEKRNKIYKELCDKKVSSDAYVEHGSQTLNLT
jgi:hypothetical protein